MGLSSFRIFIFQSTCPARGTTDILTARAKIAAFQSTCPARGTTKDAYNAVRKDIKISIHVPREGHDKTYGRARPKLRHFNPRAPRGARLCVMVYALRMLRFQSTCPARGTTSIQMEHSTSVDNFNPRAPRGARRYRRCLSYGVWRYFNPRAPRGARPINTFLTGGVYLISIHVPREGHDSSFQKLYPCFTYFNPRAPRGARPLF